MIIASDTYARPDGSIDPSIVGATGQAAGTDLVKGLVWTGLAAFGLYILFRKKP